MSLNDNFRRDLLGRVFELSQLPAIDSNVESLSNVKTFNDRFRNLQNSLLYSFRAMADIAFRDKKYLQEFFKGYANPIYTKTYAHVLKDAFKVTNYFNTNGVPVTFTEDMIFYDCDDYGNLETNDTYVYVFKNGLWLTEDKYFLYNTAYGLKAYVKSAEVADNDEISIVINKKYNNTIPVWQHTIPISASTFTSLVTVSPSNTGNFYNTKYMKLYIKKVSESYAKRVPTANYTVVMDVSGTNLTVFVSGYSMVAGDVLVMMNTTSFWSKELLNQVIPSGCCVHTPIDLIVSGTTPVPFESVYDFDIFYDEYRLIPKIHYDIAYSPHSDYPDKMVLLFDAAPGSHDIRIFKNEPAITNEFISIYANELNIKGLEEISNSSTIFDLMPKLGHCYINGRFYNNSHLDLKHKRVIQVLDTNVRNNFFYSMKLVINSEIENILNTIGNPTSGEDLVVEYLGLATVISNLYSSLPDIVDIPEVSPETDLTMAFNENAAWWVALGEYVSAALAHGTSDVVFDCNTGTLPPEFDLMALDVGLLDSNECSCSEIVIDCNISF